MLGVLRRMLQRPGTRAVRLRSRGLPASSSARWCRGSPVLSRSEGAPSDSAAVFQVTGRAWAGVQRCRRPTGRLATQEGCEPQGEGRRKRNSPGSGRRS